MCWTTALKSRLSKDAGEEMRSCNPGISNIHPKKACSQLTRGTGKTLLTQRMEEPGNPTLSVCTSPSAAWLPCWHHSWREHALLVRWQARTCGYLWLSICLEGPLMAKTFLLHRVRLSLTSDGFEDTKHSTGGNGNRRFCNLPHTLASSLLTVYVERAVFGGHQKSHPFQMLWPAINKSSWIYNPYVRGRDQGDPERGWEEKTDFH